MLDGFGHDGMHGRGQADGIDSPGQGNGAVGDVLRRKVFKKLDPKVDFGPGGFGCCGLFQGAGDILVEGAMGLQKEHTETQARAGGRDAGLDAAQPVEADPPRPPAAPVRAWPAAHSRRRTGPGLPWQRKRRQLRQGPGWWGGAWGSLISFVS